MPRSARIILPHYPHFISIAGNEGRRVFESEDDYLFYKNSLSIYSKLYKVEIIESYFRDNEVHLIVIPPDKNSIHLLLKSVQTRFARRMNKQQKKSEKVWKSRFLSSPLDNTGLKEVRKYIKFYNQGINRMPQSLKLVKSSISQNLPIGSEPFILMLEKKFNRSFKIKQRGRPRKN